MRPTISPVWRAVALVGVLVLLVPVVWAALHAVFDGPEGTLDDLMILETVEAHLATDGTPETAQLHTRLDARGRGSVELVDATAVDGLRERGRLRSPTTRDGQVVWDLDLTRGTTTRRTVADYPTDALPVSARVRYELDGVHVSAAELRGASGQAAVRIQLRNATSRPTLVVVGSADNRRVETVDLALPLLAESRLQFDETWGELVTDAGRVGAEAGGATVSWSSALFEPFGATATELEVRGEVRGATLPRLEVDATPVTAASSDLLAAAEGLLRDRATVDAVGAYLAAMLSEALGSIVDGTAQLAGGLGQLEDEIAQAAGEFDALDPEAFAADAFAGLADGLDPAAFDGLFPPDAFDLEALVAGLGDELDPADLLAALDLEALLAEFDLAAVLADADLGALLALLLAEALPELPELDLDPELVEALLRDVFDELGEQITLDELLAAIDLAALLEDVDLDAALAALLEEIDLGAVLADVLADIDLEELLAAVDLEGLLAELLGALELGDLGERLRELVGDATIGDLLGDVDVAALVALLTAEVDLEIELAAVLAALLAELDIDLPTVGRAEIAAIGEALQRILNAVRALSDAVQDALDRLGEAPGELEDLPLEELAALADGLAGRLGEIAAVLGGLADRLLDPIDAALDDAAGRLDEARAALDALEAELGEEHAAGIARIRSALEGVAGAVAAAREGADVARGELAALTAELDGLATGSAELAAALREPELVERIRQALVDPATDALEKIAAGLAEIEAVLAALVGQVEDLAADLDDDIALEELLLDALAERSIDLEPLLVDGAQRLLDLLADVRLDELLDVTGLTELLDELDLDAALEDLLAGLELPDLAAWLRASGLDLATLLTELDLDLESLLADVDLTVLLDALDAADLDLAALLDDLDIDLAALLADVDLDALFDDVDLSAVLGPLLAELDFGELEDLLADLDLDLAELLEAAGLDPAALLADVELPDFSELLADVDFDALLADLGLDPAALLADLDLPGLEGLLDELDLDLEALLAEAGLEDLGDLDQIIAGLLEALAAFAEGTDELAGALARLTEEGLGRLVAQLDDDARDMQRELATLRALERRAADAQPTATPAGATASARYRLVLDPDEPVLPGAATLGLLLAATLTAEGLRRRWTA